MRADASRFANNGDTTAEATGSAVINAETVELLSCEFVGNGDHPIAGGSWPAPDRVPLSRRVTIDDTSFVGNRATVLLIDAKVTIRASRFVENGRFPATARDAWGCCGGAITAVRSDVQIFDSEFGANGSSGFGGALHALASRIMVARSTFARNEARVGGAIMSWGRLPRVNIWGADDWTDIPRLVLSRVTCDANKATAFGGAIVFAGPFHGDGLVFRNNEATTAGGAIASWRAAPLPDPHGGVFQALLDNTKPQPVDRMVLARSAVIENHAGATGAALSFADVQAELGNVIVARNTTTALSGANLRVVNSVVADNAGAGIETPAGGSVSLGNSAMFRNSINCTLTAPALVVGPNMQNPGSDCGTQIPTVDPGLDGSYAPGLISAARGSADIGLCVSEPTVAGIDIYGATRIGPDRACAIGAVERDVFEAAAAGLTFDMNPAWGQCLMWLIFFLLLLAFIVAMLMRRAEKKT